MKKTLFFLAMLTAVALHANERPAPQRVTLNAQQPEDLTFTTSEAYRIINATLGGVQGNGLPRNVVEVPDCNHLPEIFEHIRMVFDDVLDKYVFEFLICRDIDLDVVMPGLQLPPFTYCNAIRRDDRQRNEIKTDRNSPRHLKGYAGDTVRYTWRFWLPPDFVGVNSFTHIYQVKPVDGNVSQPIFALTVRQGGALQVRYFNTSEVTLGGENIPGSRIRGNWIEVDHFMIVGTQGRSEMTITNVETGEILHEHALNILTLRADNSFIRPKWGIYRSLQHQSQLRDEAIRFANFVIEFGTPAPPSDTTPPTPPTPPPGDTTPSHLLEREHSVFSEFMIIQPHGRAEVVISGTPVFSGRHQVELISMTGVVLRSIPHMLQSGIQQDILVCGHGLPSGVYLVRISTAIGQDIHRIILP